MFYSPFDAEHGSSRSWTLRQEGPGLRFSTYNSQCEGQRSFMQPPKSCIKSCKALALVFLENPQKLNWRTPAHRGPFFLFRAHGMILLVLGHLRLRTAASLSVAFFVLFSCTTSVPVTHKISVHTSQGCPTFRMPFLLTAKETVAGSCSTLAASSSGPFQSWGFSACCVLGGIAQALGMLSQSWNLLSGPVDLLPLSLPWGFAGGSMVKNLPATREAQARSLGWEDPLG